MKKLLALLMALLMLAAPAAMAEDSTRYTLSLLDPQVFMNGEVIADMTGLGLDIDAAVTDSGLTGLILTLFAGENYDYVVDFIAQLDNNGLGMYLNGMTEAYSLDLTKYVGMNPAAMLGMMAPRTMLSSIDPAAMAIPEPDFSGEARLAAVESWIAPLVYDNLSDGATTTRHFSVTREQSAEYVAAVQSILSSFEVDTANVESFELSGAIVTTDGTPGCTIEADGRVNVVGINNSDRINIPMKLAYTDTVTAAELTITLSAPAGSDADVVVNVASTTEPIENGKTDVLTAISITADGETMGATFVVAPSSDTDEMTYSIGFDLPDTEDYVSLSLTTGINPEGDGFLLTLGMTEDGVDTFLDLWYQGGSYSDPDLGDYKSGWFEVDFAQGEETYGVGLYVLMYKEDLDSSNWALDTSYAVDAESLTDDQVNALMAEAMTVLQNVIVTLQQQVPGIAALTGLAQ